MQLSPPALEQAVETSFAALLIYVGCNWIDWIPFSMHLSFVLGDCLDVTLVSNRVFSDFDLFFSIGNLLRIIFLFLFFDRLWSYIAEIEIGRAILHVFPCPTPQQLDDLFSVGFDFFRLSLPLPAPKTSVPRLITLTYILSMICFVSPSSAVRTWDVFHLLGADVRLPFPPSTRPVLPRWNRMDFLTKAGSFPTVLSSIEALSEDCRCT